MKSILLYLFFWFIFLPWAFLHYGEWMDATEAPKKADLIVCLGGGTVERLNTSVALFKADYSNTESLMLIGESYDTPSYLEKTYPKVKIVQHHAPKNTKEEVIYIKKYMIQNGYKSALIVTDPPHSRRVKILTSILALKGDSQLSFRLIDSGVTWWKAKKYYDDKRSGETVLSETLRIIYSVWCYGIVQRLGGDCV